MTQQNSKKIIELKNDIVSAQSEVDSAEVLIDANTLLIKEEEVEGTIEAITATVDGLTTGICDKDDKIKNVTSGNAAHIVSLVVDSDAWDDIEIGTKYILKVGANGYVFKILSTGTAVPINGANTITAPANSRLVVNKTAANVAVATAEITGSITKPTS